MKEQLNNIWEYSSLNLVAILILNGFELVKFERKPIKNKDTTKIYFSVLGDLDNQKEIVDLFRNKRCIGNLNKFIEIREDLLRAIKSM